METNTCNTCQFWDVETHDTCYNIPIYCTPETALNPLVIGDVIQVINIIRLQHPELNPEFVQKANLISTTTL